MVVKMGCEYICKIITAGYMLGEWLDFVLAHYTDVRMSVMGSQITSVSIVCSTVCSGADQRKNQSFASLAFVRGIHQWPVNSPHKGPVMRKMFPFDDVIMSQGKVRGKSRNLFQPTLWQPWLGQSSYCPSGQSSYCPSGSVVSLKDMRYP